MGLETLRPGDELDRGRFRIRSLLGEGGMGRVYRAYDAKLERDVALKILIHLAPEDLYRLKREFRTLAGFSHPNLIQLYELFVDRECCFLTMQLLEGESLVRHVRRGTPTGVELDPAAHARLRSAFLQLVTALRVLHEAGQFHRDVKPSNVVVVEDGRVVLLDFGLATLGRRGFESEHLGFVGTLPYVAFEQAWGEAPSAAADWYSFGATLYEVLTGAPPFTGSLAEVIHAKQQKAPPAPSALVPDVPAELDALVTALLSRDPARRPSPDRIVEALSGPARSERCADAAPIPFVGRLAELERLAALLARSRAAPVVTYVRGSSGIGKSELVHRFARRSRDEGALVLSGRCLPQESIAYRALDPLMDELSRHLVKLPEAAAAELAPRFSDALLRLFPALARVGALAKAPESGVAGDEELVRRGFLALRELLARIADRRPLILWIDDAQWGDRGSIALLRVLLRPPDAPRLLLVISYRSEDEDSSVLVAGLRAGGFAEGVTEETLDVAPLPEGDSLELVERLVAPHAPLADSDVRSVITDSAGSPFFMIQLVRYLTQQRERPEHPGIERVLSERLRPLSRDARSILDLVAVAGRPISAAFVLERAGIGPGGRPLVLELCAQSLLRAAGSEERDEIETYHDRIRETVLADLETVELRATHRKLAEGLRAQRSPDPAAVVEHFLGAGEDALAAAYALEAAAAASAGLAFERAADFYALADRLRGERDDDWELRVRRAEALATAGRSAEAADAYLAASTSLARCAPGAAGQARLVRCAAEQYLYAGHTRSGLERTEEVMRQLRIAIPATPAAAARSANLSRLRFMLLHRRVHARPAGAIAPEVHDRLESLFGIAKGTAILLPKLSDFLGMLYLREALAAGDTGHIAIALAKEASIEGALPGSWWRRRGGRLLARADAIATSSGLPHVVGTVHTCWGAYFYFSGQWRRALQHCEQAVEIFRTQCVGEWESTTHANLFLLGALAQLGDLQRMSRLVPELAEDARRRGDLTARNVFYTSDAVLVTLAADDPAGATETADRVLDSLSGEHYTSHDYHHLVGTVKADLYAGDGGKAWQRVDRAWPSLRGNGFLSFEGLAITLRYARGCAAISAVRSGGAPPASRRRLEASAAADAAWLARSKLPHGAPLSSSIRAGLAALRGDSSAQIAALGRALAGFASADMALYATACRLHLARLGAADASQPLAEMAAQGVRNPDAMAGTLVPGGPTR